MAEHIKNIHETSGFLSEQEKARFGWDIASFTRRMNDRLRKVRGEDTENTDTFLVRHHYYKSSHSIA